MRLREVCRDRPKVGRVSQLRHVGDAVPQTLRLEEERSLRFAVEEQRETQRVSHEDDVGEYARGPKERVASPEHDLDAAHPLHGLLEGAEELREVIGFAAE